MIPTITIEIFNEKVLNLLHDLELMKLIKVREDKKHLPNTNWAKYKGGMTKQSLNDIEHQLNELRNEWE